MPFPHCRYVLCLFANAANIHPKQSLLFSNFDQLDSATVSTKVSCCLLKFSEALLEQSSIHLWSKSGPDLLSRSDPACCHNSHRNYFTITAKQAHSGPFKNAIWYLITSGAWNDLLHTLQGFHLHVISDSGPLQACTCFQRCVQPACKTVHACCENNSTG